MTRPLYQSRIWTFNRLGYLMSVALEWKAQDLWLGAYWARKGAHLSLWICVLPCLPIHLQVTSLRWLARQLGTTWAQAREADSDATGVADSV